MFRGPQTRLGDLELLPFGSGGTGPSAKSGVSQPRQGTRALEVSQTQFNVGCSGLHSPSLVPWPINATWNE